MQAVSDVTAEARTLISGLEARNITNPWFAAKTLIFTAAWLIGDLSRSETDRVRHIANLQSISGGLRESAFRANPQCEELKANDQ